MAIIIVPIPTPLRAFTDGVDRLNGQGGTGGEVVLALGRDYKGLGQCVLNRSVRAFVDLFLHCSDIRALEGLDTRVADGQSLAIVPAVAGGGS